MTIRRILEEHEAILFDAEKRGLLRPKRGKAERKRFGDGDEELSVRFRGVDLPDGSVVVVAIGPDVVGEAAVERKRGRLELSKDAGDDVPEVKTGGTIEIRHGSTALLRGEFRPG